MLKYKIIKQRNALDENNEMYYPRLAGRGKYELKDVAEAISERNTLSKADVIATLISLEEIVPYLLTSGYSVSLGDLGTFSLQANASSFSDKSKVTWRSFKSVKVRFRAGKALKILLSNVSFKRLE